MKEKIFSLQPPLGEPVHLYKNVWTGGSFRETLSIVGGLQGDQLNGLYIASQLSRFLQRVEEGGEPGYSITGKIQLFPLVNMLAVQSGSRLWHYDNLDTDMAFPGNPKGEVIERLCDTIYKHTAESEYGLLLYADDYEQFPHIQIQRANRSLRDMARGFGLKIVREIDLFPCRKLKLIHHWQDNGVRALLLTGGKNNSIDYPLCDNLFLSVVNFMLTMGVLSHRERKEREHQVDFYTQRDECVVVSAHAGLFLPSVRVGDLLKEGQKIGELRDIYSGETIVKLTAPKNGFLVTLRNHPVVYEREPLATLLTEPKPRWHWPF
ncbi:MAG: hypothetical protein A3K09_03415 [Nitrospinae bacterium RIFCSPLOWO2_12_FULL_47_7]|nr:MAG: hypothetical protein A3K09_03415 [Nitrospinae bacterium RIFCSPLOWO2_12_FULL_47_7]